MIDYINPPDDWNEEEQKAQEGPWTAQIPDQLISLLSTMIGDHEEHHALIAELSATVHELTYRLAAMDRRVRELEGKDDRPE